jgi:hypothetical protein
LRFIQVYFLVDSLQQPRTTNVVYSPALGFTGTDEFTYQQYRDSHHRSGKTTSATAAQQAVNFVVSREVFEPR